MLATCPPACCMMIPMEKTLMRAARVPFRFLPVALALGLAGCGSMSGPGPSPRTDDAPPHASGRAGDASLANQTEAARLKMAGDFCENHRQLLDNAHRFLRREALPMPPPGLTLEQARCGAREFVKGLIPSAGTVVGYKAERVGSRPGPIDKDNPAVTIRGTLLEKMMLPNGVGFQTDRFAINPRMTAGLVAVVRSAAIHDAQTPRELLASLSAIHPFIELPDLAYEKPDQIDAAAATLANANARFGVLGAPIQIQINQTMVEQLANMTVRLRDQRGDELEATPGASLEGNPLNALLSLVHELEKTGVRLRPGDLLSAGTFGARHVPEANNAYRLSYEGLPGDPEVTVHFQ